MTSTGRRRMRACGLSEATSTLHMRASGPPPKRSYWPPAIMTTCGLAVALSAVRMQSVGTFLTISSRTSDAAVRPRDRDVSFTFEHHHLLARRHLVGRPFLRACGPLWTV